MNHRKKMSDRLVSSLCDKIDSLEDAVKYWKGRYDEEVAANNKQLDKQLDIAKKNVADMFRVVLMSHDDEEGNLVIKKENRGFITKTIKRNFNEDNVH